MVIEYNVDRMGHRETEAVTPPLRVTWRTAWQGVATGLKEKVLEILRPVCVMLVSGGISGTL